MRARNSLTFRTKRPCGTISGGLSLMDWAQTAWDTAKILIAYLLALPIGWEREREAHSVGVRTFPLVAMASCGFVLIGTALGGGDKDVRSRIIQGVITGIGFIGGGAV